jgi:hypothetical protein
MPRDMAKVELEPCIAASDGTAPATSGLPEDRQIEQCSPAGRSSLSRSEDPPASAVRSRSPVVAVEPDERGRVKTPMLTNLGAARNPPSRPRASAVGLALWLLFGLAACTGSPSTLALQPDFEVMTAAGVASVSIRQSFPGTTYAEFTRLVRTGMERATPGDVLGKPVGPPFPWRRIVWHVNPSGSRAASRLSVNVFDGSVPYAYEQEVLENGAPPGAITSAVRWMSERLLADIAILQPSR